MLNDGSGSWEGHSVDGRVVSSAKIDDYIRSGDKYGVFQAVDYSVPPGKYEIELMVPGPNNRSFPFLSSIKADVNVSRGRLTEVFLSVPKGWNPIPAAVAADLAAGYSLCPPGQNFDINERSDALLNWAKGYQDDPLRRALLKASVIYRKGDDVVKLELDSGVREVDGMQVRAILGAFRGSPYSTLDVAYCRSRYPQFASAFSEFDATINNIRRDIEAFGKMAEAMELAKQNR